MKPYCPFPEDFLWGSATASYQVEGAAAVDGRAPSIWDTFSHLPGRVENDHHGDVAVDQYHLYKEDVQLMKWLGLKAYRFSLSWSRVLPDGIGAVNEKGADYYDRLVDELLANDIQPWITFFHWDLPQALEDTWGGWASPQTAKAFGEFVSLMTTRLSDRVTNFFTINEFQCFTDMGYRSGGPHAPGRSMGVKGANQVRHNGLLAHGHAVAAIRSNAKQKVKVGLAENSGVCVPVMETEGDIEACRKAMREVNAHFLTTILEGKYPDCYLQTEAENAPEYTDDEMKLIGAPLDFVGLNMYAPNYYRAADNDSGYEAVPHPISYPRMNMPWLFIGPQITYWGPRHLKEIWGVDEVYITENGCACEDRLTQEGEVYDTDRVLYLRNHFISAHRAVDEGWPLKGYFVWSLLDNFEWSWGYNKRFGITYVNYETKKRTPKLSAKFYKEVIAEGRVV